MGKFKVPVEWAVCDFVEVEADSFKDAVKYVVDNRDKIPLGTEPEYIDGSYKINSEDEVSIFGKTEDQYVDELTEKLFGFGYGENIDVPYENVESDIEDLFKLETFIEGLGWSVQSCKTGLESGPIDYSGWALLKQTESNGLFSFTIIHEYDVEKAVDGIYDYYMSFCNDVEDVEMCPNADEIDEMLKHLSDNVSGWLEQQKGKSIDDIVAEAKSVAEDINNDFIGKDKVDVEKE